MNRTHWIIVGVIGGVVVLALALGFGLGFGLRRGGSSGGHKGTCRFESQPTNSSLCMFRYAAVAADAPDCSRIGKEMMSNLGGSAVDAAIAAMICVGVINLQSTGVGGGHFMILYDTRKGGQRMEIKSIIAREMAPQAATPNMFVNASRDNLSTRGGLAIAVPGEVRGFHEAWKLYGRVPWRSLWEPSIQLCEEGHVITPDLAKRIKSNEKVIRSEPNLRELLIKPDNKTYKEGDIIKRPKLARTLRRIADDPYTFYNGSLADDIVADIQEHDGNITLNDLGNYTALVKDPVRMKILANHTSFTVPAPSGGPILTYILNILKGYNFGPDAVSNTNNKTLTYHRIIEAFKHAYAMRSWMGDEDYVEGIKELTENLTRTDFGEWIRSQILDNQTLPNETSYNPGPILTRLTTGGTSHVSVIGPNGGAAAVTSSINFYFGSKVRGNRTGIIFNNHMDDFSTPGKGGLPSPSNYIQPGKRPRSSASPVIVLDPARNAVFISGAAGGARITTTVSFITMETLWFDMSLLDSVDTIRFHHPLVPNHVQYEAGFSEEVIRGLQAKLHKLRLLKNPPNIANVHSIHNTCPLCGQNCGQKPCIHAVTDRRKASKPDGY